MDKKKYRKRKKLKRLIIAYLLRALVALMLIGMITLMVCGCLYIYNYFTEKDDVVGTYTDYYTAFNNADYDADRPALAVGEESKFCVVIDAGHGGSDGGTVSGEIIEKDINLSVALKLKAILEENNIEVILTRNSDDNVSLTQRVSIANESNADFFISLHCNYYEDDAQVSGLECYYNDPDATESKMYAESIINATSLSADIISREAKVGSYYVLRNTKIPAVLVEMGFLSNCFERQKLLSKDYQEILSQKISEGILNICFVAP